MALVAKVLAGGAVHAPRPSPVAPNAPSLPRPAFDPATTRSARRTQHTCYSYSSGSYGASTTQQQQQQQRREAQLEVLRKELKGLEEERDEAVRVAESCAKTCVRLTDMQRLLEDLALEKVKAGDEAGARAVLQEKNSLREIIDKSNEKAQANFMLAGKLAAKIGDKHNDLVALLGQGQGQGQGGAAAAAAPASPRVAAWPEPPGASGSSYGGSGYGGYGGSTAGSAAGGGYQMPWEKSIAEAQQRVRQAESEANRMGRLAALGAEDSIAAARERLRQRGPAGGGSGAESILEARARLRRSAEDSIAAARERLAKQDAALLEYCRRIVARYRRGEAVSEDELEFAFDQMERRLL